jgi:hypothetical protein
MRSLFRAALVAVPLVALSCNKHTPPSNPDPVATPTIAPAAAPSEPPPVVAAGCGAGPSEGAANCVRLSPAFLEDVDAAINRVVARRPELFNFDDERGRGGYYVKDSDEYYREVVNELQQAGFCAVADGGEVAVKVDNSLNDQFHIMISDGHIRRGEASYRATCRPAWF